MNSFTTEGKDKGKCVYCLSITREQSDKLLNVWCCDRVCEDKLIEKMMREIREKGGESP